MGGGVCVCVAMEAEAWHLSGWGAYENICLSSGQISTSVIITLVTDSQTLRMLPPSQNKIRKK